MNTALACYGFQAPVCWTQAQGALNAIPYTQYGNTLTLVKYSDNICVFLFARGSLTWRLIVPLVAAVGPLSLSELVFPAT